MTDDRQAGVMANINPARNRHLRSADGAAIRIRLLGPFSLEIAGKPVVVASKRARAMLAYLVQREGSEAARTTLTGLLWGERGEEQARASLRQTLSELRALSRMPPSNPSAPAMKPFHGRRAPHGSTQQSWSRQQQQRARTNFPKRPM
ncbi:MAG: hypothetical protein HC855_12990 [Rhizobiales bacterium]|nr:hypothetical protein [Hyphomicrobiales bacterium]